MSEGNNIPYLHAEMHIVEGVKYKVTIKVHKHGFREMIIQNVDKNKVVGIDEEEKEKRTWLRDWTNYK